MPGAIEQANTTVQEVQRELGRDGSSQQAVTLLLTEIAEERTRLDQNQITPGDFNTYVNTVLNGLQNELPMLSVGWVANNANNQSFVTRDILGTSGEPIVNTAMIDALVVGNADPVQRRLAEEFRAQIDQIDGRNRYNYQDTQVSFAEVNQFLDDNDSEVANLTYARMFSSQAGHTLLSEIDSAGMGIFANVKDGNFDRGNLGALINEVRNNAPHLQGTMRALEFDTQMSREEILDTLQHMYDNWDSDQMRLMQNNGLMNLESIAQGAGFDSMADCAEACEINEALISPSVENNQVNSPDTALPAVDTGSSRLLLNSANMPVTIEYNNLNRRSTHITYAPNGTTPISIDTGDGNVLSFNQATQQWNETRYDAATSAATSIPIDTPVINAATGQISYSYLDRNATRVEYQANGDRLETEASGASEVVTQPVAAADATASAAPAGFTYDTGGTSFGEAATALALARNNNALSDDPATRRTQIQNAKIDLLIRGYEMNVLELSTGHAPADDPVVAALNSMRANNGIGEWVSYGNERISIYRMLRGSISV